MSDIEELESRLRNMREALPSAISDTFYYGYYAGQLTGAYEALARLKAQPSLPAPLKQKPVKRKKGA